MSCEKQKILLVTAGFPFADTERGFISTEFDCLQQHYDPYILVWFISQTYSFIKTTDRNNRSACCPIGGN